MRGRVPSAPESIASRTPIAASAGAQLRSTILLYWYHATAIRPCGPAVSHGQLTVTPARGTPGGVRHVRPAGEPGLVDGNSGPGDDDRLRPRPATIAARGEHDPVGHGRPVA